MARHTHYRAMPVKGTCPVRDGNCMCISQLRCECRNCIDIWAASWQNQQNDCAPSEGSDQPGHPPSAQSDQSSLCAQLVAKAPSFLHADSEDSDRTGRMPRLIWVFTGRTCHSVGFVMRRLILQRHYVSISQLYGHIKLYGHIATTWVYHNYMGI